MNLHLKHEFQCNVLSVDRTNTGVQYVFKFDNNYGASIIKRRGSYGLDKDLWELAVIRFESVDVWRLTYDTEITDNVIGYLTDEEVNEILHKIKNL